MIMYGFFALINRLRYINRWSLMRSSVRENVSEHSWEAAVLAHALAVIGRDVFGKQLDPDKIAVAALFHDASEVLTGDMPTPVKYKNEALKKSYKDTEKASREVLLGMLPDKLKGEYCSLLNMEENDTGNYRYVKAADKLSAYLKCIEEAKAGNREFTGAEKEIKKAVDAFDLPELGYFMDNFIGAYTMNIDEINKI